MSAASRCSRLTALLSCAAMALFMLCATTAGWSQASFTAQLSGTVTDTTGAAIPNASVVLTNESTGIAHSAQSDGAGRFSFVNLQPASYSIVAKAQGFAVVRQNHLVFNVSQQSVLNLKLAVAGASTSVTVTSAPVLLNDSNALLGTDVTTRYIDQVPLLDRNMEKLAYLAPGVVTAQGYQTDQTNENFSSNGQRNSETEIRLDGGLLSTPEAGEGAQEWAHFQPSIEVVQEFKMETNGFSAEYGDNGGTVMNEVTKSGGNKIHGSAYFFARNSATDANNWYAQGQALPAYHRNIAGGTIGGPIIKNRLFYFGNYEWTSFSQPQTVTTTVPTDDEKKGNFLNSLTEDANGNPVEDLIYDPYTYDANTGLRQAYNNNTIPGGEITPLAQKIMALYPEATGSGNVIHQNNFTKNYADGQPAHQYNAKVDWTITQNNKLSTRYSKGYLRRESPTDFEGAIGQGDERNDYNNAVSQYDRTISSHVFLTARLGVDRHHQSRQSDATPNLVAFGFPEVVANLNGYQTFPGIGISNEQNLGLGSYTRTIEAETAVLVDATLSIIKGAHSIKFGTEHRILYDNFFQPAWPGGNFNYNQSATRQTLLSSDQTQGNGIASFLIDWGSGGSETIHPPIAEKSSEQSFFVQDDWKATRNLTVNIGLRWDDSIPYNSRLNENQFADYTADTGMSVDLSGGNSFLQSMGFGPTELHGVAEFATPHHREEGSDLNNFGPRIGFAYRMGQSTVLSAGGGLYYGLNPLTSYQDQGSVWRKNINWYPSLDNGATLTATLENPWPNGYSGPQGKTYGALNQWGIGSDANQDNTFRNAEIYLWNVTVQRELRGAGALSVAWVANKSTHLSYGDSGSSQRDYAPSSKIAAISQAQHALDPNCDQDNCVTNFLNQLVPNPFYSMFNGPSAIFNQPDANYAQSPTFGLTNLLVPYPQFAGDFSGDDVFYSSAVYNALQVKFRRNYSGGANVLASYTLAKGNDNSSSSSNGWLGNSQGIQQLDNLRWGEWSSSATDVRHRVVAGGTYELPLGRGRRFGGTMNRAADGVVGGWQASGYLTLQSGEPIDVSQGNGRLAFGNQRPNVSGNPRSKYTMHDLAWDNLKGGTESFFNVSAFSNPGDQIPGNSPRFNDALRGDSVRDLDFSVSKNFAIKEGDNLEVRVESFNLTNSPQFADPNSSFQGGSFGTVSGQVNSPRQLQFGTRFTF